VYSVVDPVSLNPDRDPDPAFQVIPDPDTDPDTEPDQVPNPETGL
jgi:hypothetical protein